MIDTHCHVHGAEFDRDRQAVLEAAARAGVGLVLTMGEGLDDDRRALEVAGRHDGLRPCLGLHPDRVDREEVDPVVELIRLNAHRITAIGEVGLDFRVAEEADARQRQRDALGRLVALALELDLPLSVHSRSAGHHAIDLLQQHGARRVCLHAFDGAAKHAVRAAELGYLLSVPPSVVRSQQKRKLVQRVPLSSLMLETDSPVLGPERDVRNEPANAVVAARAIAEIQGCTVEQVAEVTTDNARRLFRL